MKKFLLTGVLTLFTAGVLVGCGEPPPHDPDEVEYLDESEVEVEVTG